MRTPLMAANWKMNCTLGEAVALVEGLLAEIGGSVPAGREVLLCPPATALSTVGALLDNTGVALGGQNMYYQESGAYTGEISPWMLKDVGATHVILGHSERRQIFGESDDLINRKVKAAIENSLIPVFAVGELLDQREAGDAEKVVAHQLVEGLAGLVGEEVAKVVVAYEPVWAIGTGKTASPADAQAMHAMIRAWLTDRYGAEVADGIRILYGGSVKANNVDELMAQPDIDGALVGGAALDAKGFGRIVNFQS